MRDTCPLLYPCRDHYGPAQSGGISPRHNGAMISNSTGKALGYALFNLQERGRMLVGPGSEVYEGQVVGIHSRDNDLTVNPLKAKQLTNIRAAGSDENILLTPPIRFSLEQALEFIEEDELVEITPSAIRIRKRHLKEHERKKASRGV
jgi:GTP-binding protein